MIDWRTDAACRGLDPALFYPDGPGHGDQTHAAARICRTCPVIGDCLRHALDQHEDEGVWGGSSATQRRVMWSRRRKVRAA